MIQYLETYFARRIRKVLDPNVAEMVSAIPESVNNPDGYGGERRLVHDRQRGSARIPSKPVFV